MEVQIDLKQSEILSLNSELMLLEFKEQKTKEDEKRIEEIKEILFY